MEVLLTYVATQDEYLKAIKADSGGLQTPSGFDRAVCGSEMFYCGLWRKLELVVFDEMM